MNMLPTLIEVTSKASFAQLKGSDVIHPFEDFGEQADASKVRFNFPVKDDYFAVTQAAAAEGRFNELGHFICRDTQGNEIEIAFIHPTVIFPIGADLPDMDIAKPTVIVEMDCGAIHKVTTNIQCNVILLDADVEGSDGESVIEVDGEDQYLHFHSANVLKPGESTLDPDYVTEKVRAVREGMANT